MAIAIDPREVFEYVLEADRELPEDEQTVWLLKPMSYKEERALKRRLSSGKAVDLVDATEDILRDNLRGWKVGTFRKADGTEIAPDVVDGKATEETLGMIDHSWRTELANAITSRGRLTVKDSD